MRIREEINAPCVSKARILVVEAYSNLCELYRELFEQKGYDVRTASGGAEADEAMKLLMPDVVVIDPAEPTGMRQVIQEIQSDSDVCPLVVVNSGTVLMGGSEEMDCADAYVLKSSDVDSLMCGVESVLNSSSADIDPCLQRRPAASRRWLGHCHHVP